MPSFDMERYARESEQDLRIAEEAPTRPRGSERSLLIEAAPTVEVEDSVSDEEAERALWARIGDDAQVPVLLRPLEDVLWDPRAPGEVQVLSAIDGHSTVRSIVESCGLPALAAVQTICDLLESHVIAFAK